MVPTLAKVKASIRFPKGRSLPSKLPLGLSSLPYMGLNGVLLKSSLLSTFSLTAVEGFVAAGKLSFPEFCFKSKIADSGDRKEPFRKISGSLSCSR